ncbi:MAG: tail fiber domain-containing protein [Acidobacteriota bacterium]
MQSIKLRRVSFLSPLLLLLFLALCVPAESQAQPAVEATVQGDVLVLRPQIEHRRIAVTVQAADGSVREQSFDAAPEVLVPLRSESGGPLPDGLVSWEVVIEPRLSDDEGEMLKQARARGETLERYELIEAGVLPGIELRTFGAVRFSGGGAAVASSEGSVAEVGPGSEETRSLGAVSAVTAASRQTGFLAEEDEIIGDLVVRGSQCVGTSCVNPESYGLDTVRLKEANLRIHFDDVSNSPFPANDWRIEINDSNIQGPSYFLIQDVTANRSVFRLDAGARSNALVVDSQGEIGIGTSVPSRELHVVDGDSPGLRLEQDGSRGFASQIWEITGNESAFIVRDVTNGGTIPFRIRNEAGANAIFVNEGSDIGFGTSSPTARLHVQADEAGNFGGLRVVNSGAGNIQTQFASTSGNWEWRQTFRSGDLIFDSQEDGANELELTTGGQLTVVSVVETSDRALKENFRPVDRSEVLSKIVELPITRWNYIELGADVEHLGPMAQDFHQAFGVGPDDQHIATRDAASVALVGVQALHDELEVRDARVAAVEAVNAALLQRLEALEQLIQE